MAVCREGFYWCPNAQFDGRLLPTENRCSTNQIVSNGNQAILAKTIRLTFSDRDVDRIRGARLETTEGVIRLGTLRGTNGRFKIELDKNYIITNYRVSRNIESDVRVRTYDALGNITLDVLIEQS